MELSYWINFKTKPISFEAYHLLRASIELISILCLATKCFWSQKMYPDNIKNK